MPQKQKKDHSAKLKFERDQGILFDFGIAWKEIEHD